MEACLVLVPVLGSAPGVRTSCCLVYQSLHGFSISGAAQVHKRWIS